MKSTNEKIGVGGGFGVFGGWGVWWGVGVVGVGFFGVCVVLVGWFVGGVGGGWKRGACAFARGG